MDFLNPVAEELGRLEVGRGGGRPLEDVFRIVNEDTRQPVENPALRALKDGKIVGLANHTVLISKDGTERPIDDCAAPIRDQRATSPAACWSSGTSPSGSGTRRRWPSGCACSP